MEKFKILEHTADLKIKVFGKTKKELFKNALFAMAKALCSESKSQKIINRKIKNKSFNSEMLLVDFLSEVLYLSQVKKEVYFDVRFKKFSDTEIEGELFGKKVERFSEDIKGVTYHNLSIKQRKDKIFEAIIVFDL